MSSISVELELLLDEDERCDCGFEDGAMTTGSAAMAAAGLRMMLDKSKSPSGDDGETGDGENATSGFRVNVTPKGALSSR